MDQAEIERIIDEYTESLNRILKRNAKVIAESRWDGRHVRWIGQEVTRNDAPGIVKAGKEIKRSMSFYELSL